MTKPVLRSLAMLIATVGACSAFYRVYADTGLGVAILSWRPEAWQVWAALLAAQISCQWLAGYGLLHWLARALSVANTVVDYVFEWALDGFVTFFSEVPRRVRARLMERI